MIYNLDEHFNNDQEVSLPMLLHNSIIDKLIKICYIGAYLHTYILLLNNFNC
jgi:hypothetical protein